MPRKLGGGKGEKRRDRDTERMIRELKKNEPVLQEATTTGRARSRSTEKKMIPELKNFKSESSMIQIKEESKGNLAIS